MLRPREKNAFEPAPDVHIHIILHRRKVSSAQLLSNETFCSIYNDPVGGQRRPRPDCASAQSGLGHRCPHMPQRHIFAGRGPFAMKFEQFRLQSLAVSKTAGSVANIVDQITRHSSGVLSVPTVFFCFFFCFFFFFRPVSLLSTRQCCNCVNLANTHLNL